jgi:hypothetical protein
VVQILTRPKNNFDGKSEPEQRSKRKWSKDQPKNKMSLINELKQTLSV